MFSPKSPKKLGERSVARRRLSTKTLGAKSAGGGSVSMYLSDIFTCTANLAGVPGLSLPIGRVGGLPAGGQLMAAHFDEQRMFAIATALETALGDEAHS